MLENSALTSTQNPLGVEHAWRWLARLLNHLPPTRVTASALEAFVKTGGFRLFRVYGRQFYKLLLYIHGASAGLVRCCRCVLAKPNKAGLAGVFIAELDGKAQTNSDITPVLVRLRSYLDSREFGKEPDGRRMARDAESDRIEFDAEGRMYIRGG